MNTTDIIIIVVVAIFALGALAFFVLKKLAKKGGKILAADAMKFWDENFPKELNKLQIKPTSTIVVDSREYFDDPTQKGQVKYAPNFAFCLDTNAKKFAFVKLNDPVFKDKRNITSDIFEFESISSCALMEGGRQLDSTTVGTGIGTGVGGYGVGLGTASTTSESYLSSLQIVIHFKDLNKPIYTIDMFKGQTNESGGYLKKWKNQAVQINSILNKIIEENK